MPQIHCHDQETYHASGITTINVTANLNIWEQVPLASPVTKQSQLTTATFKQVCTLNNNDNNNYTNALVLTKLFSNL